MSAAAAYSSKRMISIKRFDMVKVFTILLVVVCCTVELALLLRHTRTIATNEKGKKAENSCPQSPVYLHLNSWDDWERSNCSSTIPLVPFSDGHASSTLPLFVIIGEQKCGTTFLRTLLNQHPLLHAGIGAYGNKMGETHFFDRMIKARHIPLERVAMVKAYSDYFIVKGKKKGDPTAFAFETSPSYLALHPLVPWRIAAILPKLKFVVVVRDPVDRYESARRMLQCFPKPDQLRAETFYPEGRMREHLGSLLSQSAPPNLPLSLQRGLYMGNLKRWLLHFPREQFFVVESNSLFDEPARVVNALVTEFLQLPAFRPDIGRALEIGRNQGNECTPGRTSYSLGQDDRQALVEFYRRPNRELEEFLGKGLSWQK